MPSVLNNREWAVLIWLVIVVVAMLLNRDLRLSLKSLALAFVTPKLLGPIIVFAGYIFALVILGREIGFWTDDLIGSTVAWFVAGGIVLFMRSTNVSEKPRFIRHQLRRAVGIAALLEPFVNLYVFSLPVELFLFPLLALIVVMSAVADTKEEFAQVGKLLRGVMAVASVCFIAYVAIHLANASGSHLAGDLRKLALPIWLTVGGLPFIFWFGLLMAYEMSFTRIDFCRWADERARRRAKLALLLGVKLRAERLGAFDSFWAGRVVREPDLSTARRVARQFATES